MTHEPEPITGGGPDEISQLRATLERRATPGHDADPTTLYASAERRARARSRHQIGAGLLVAVLLAGSVVSVVALNHGRATVGVSVASPPGDPTATTAAPTTTSGSGGPEYTTSCGDGFFPAALEAQLTQHFGPRSGCERVQSTWVVSFGGPAQGAMVAALLPCTSTDQACLDPDAPHDFGSFRVLYLPPTPTRGNTFEFSSSKAPGYTDVQVTFGYPLLPPTVKPIPTVHIEKSSDEAALKVTVGSACEPVKGPATTRWIGPFALVPGSEALANPLPNWTSLPVLPASC